MNVLIACEESQRVCAEFRKRGHNAFSCDIQECSGGHPEWHIKDDVLSILNGRKFTTQNGSIENIDKWDLIIAHPPCTYLTVAGNRWFNVEKYGEKAIQRHKDREDAIDFFMYFVAYAKVTGCKMAIENPIGCMSTDYRKPDQTIQPYQFGHPTRKATCLWLYNLPKLTPTDIVEPEFITLKNGKNFAKWHYETWGLSEEERRRERSKTFSGIAKAMAEQWGGAQ